MRSVYWKITSTFPKTSTCKDAKEKFLNYFNVTILVMDFIRDISIAKDGNIMIKKIILFSIVFDQRIGNGAEAVGFGNSIKNYLEARILGII